jgi:hypothetical protein
VIECGDRDMRAFGVAKVMGVQWGPYGSHNIESYISLSSRVIYYSDTNEREYMFETSFLVPWAVNKHNFIQNT